MSSDPHEAIRTVCLCDRIDRLPCLTPTPEKKVLLRIKTYYEHSPELGVFLHKFSIIFHRISAVFPS